MTEIASMRQEWSNLDLDFRRIKNLVMINKTKGIYHLQKIIEFFFTQPQKFEVTLGIRQSHLLIISLLAPPPVNGPNPHSSKCSLHLLLHLLSKPIIIVALIRFRYCSSPLDSSTLRPSSSIFHHTRYI